MFGLALFTLHKHKHKPTVTSLINAIAEKRLLCYKQVDLLLYYVFHVLIAKWLDLRIHLSSYISSSNIVCLDILY
jgi:hypothetical protein